MKECISELHYLTDNSFISPVFLMLICLVLISVTVLSNYMVNAGINKESIINILQLTSAITLVGIVGHDNIVVLFIYIHLLYVLWNEIDKTLNGK